MAGADAVRVDDAFCTDDQMLTPGVGGNHAPQTGHLLQTAHPGVRRAMGRPASLEPTWRRANAGQPLGTEHTLVPGNPADSRRLALA